MHDRKQYYELPSSLATNLFYKIQEAIDESNQETSTNNPSNYFDKLSKHPINSTIQEDQ